MKELTVLFVNSSENIENLIFECRLRRGAYHSKKSVRDFWDFKNLKIFMIFLKIYEF